MYKEKLPDFSHHDSRFKIPSLSLFLKVFTLNNKIKCLDLKNLTEAEISNKVVENQRKKSETLSPFVRRKFIVPPNELQNNIESASLSEFLNVCLFMQFLYNEITFSSY